MEEIGPAIISVAMAVDQPEREVLYG